ncbi:hypothetical protein [Blastopirellula marina]|uniref:Nif11 domain-containing protein n=1 Tax=Blastopirellula marina TaxID=124 RepID=A0A2S8G9B6_9BACT|nr:hypothetical protein [Blastopirellula marina]PQO41056.1 hypothetical protein C5Y98_03575 [Blastopirellula marina]PTL45932.1 hypothetical protein C5Y97_03575 [Blastopirellula marina]
MRQSVVINFLRHLGDQSELRRHLRTMSKSQVMAEAQRIGFVFSENEYDEVVWGAEMFLAEKLGEPFDFQLSLWKTMWGKYYLDFVLDDVIASLTPELEQEFLAGKGEL